MSTWDQFTRASCLPYDCGCEFVNVNSLIAQSSAFWSSFFHLIIAYLFYKSIARRDQKAALWFASVFLLAFGSIFNHGTFLEVAAALDFAGIVLVVSYFGIYSILSRLNISNASVILLFILYAGFIIYIFYSLGKREKIAICALVIGLEIYFLIRDKGIFIFHDKDFKYSLIIFSISLLFFFIDEFKIFCDPHSWLTGHSIWHLGTAVGLNYYGRFRLKKD